jgi:hypothetical protein
MMGNPMLIILNPLNFRDLKTTSSWKEERFPLLRFINTPGTRTVSLALKLALLSFSIKVGMGSEKPGG